MTSLQNKCPECDGPLGDSSNQRCWLCNIEKPTETFENYWDRHFPPGLQGQLLDEPTNLSRDQVLSEQFVDEVKRNIYRAQAGLYSQESWEKGWTFTERRSSPGPHPREIKTGVDFGWIYGISLVFWVFTLVMLALKHFNM